MAVTERAPSRTDSTRTGKVSPRASKRFTTATLTAAVRSGGLRQNVQSRYGLPPDAMTSGKLLAPPARRPDILRGDRSRTTSMANIRNRYLFLWDLLLLAAAPLLAYAIRFEGVAWSAADLHTATVYAALSVALKLGIFLPFGLYSRLWRHASIPDLAKIVQANATSTAACADVGRVIAQQEVDEVVIAMPTAPGRVVRGVVRAAIDAGIPTRTVPALFDILSGRVSLSNLRKVEIQDLLRREPVRTDLGLVRTVVSGVPVLVTGAGGSIGSELARQLAHLGPSHLVLLGNGENEIFDILGELRAAHPSLQLSPVIADVRDLPRLRSGFRRLHPHAVFHAAAHKHVPLMEENVADAITNNVVGTGNVVCCAAESDTQHFVLISTDKAVRPTSIMGATKRVAEMVVHDAAIRQGRNFVSVRFGNVLGSRCSVVPIFLGQIRAGGPVTITPPDMRRYFMTIPEAVQLVLQASALGRGGETFVLDMGEPIRIVDLASDLVRLSGLEVGRDIEIRFTGIRPGERLFEEPFFRHEEVLPTGHPKVLRATDNHAPPDVAAAVQDRKSTRLNSS